MVHIYFHGESEPPDVSASPMFVNHEIPLISEEEPTIPFFPFPHFPMPIWVPPGDNVEVGKFENQIADSSLQPSSRCNGGNLEMVHGA